MKKQQFKPETAYATSDWSSSIENGMAFLIEIDNEWGGSKTVFMFCKDGQTAWKAISRQHVHFSIEEAKREASRQVEQYKKHCSERIEHYQKEMKK